MAEPAQAPVPTNAVCPVCATSCAGQPPMERYSAHEAAAHFCPLWRNPDRHNRLVTAIRNLWGQDFTTIHRCPNCGFGFGWPHIGGDNAFYSIIHEEFGYPAWRWEYTVARDLAARRFPSGGNAIDIGSGDGGFLLGLPSNWVRHATESTETTRNLLRAKNIKVFDDLDHAARSAPRSFQLVTLFQVIEHVAEFAPMLRSIAQLLAPGGVLVMSTPYFDELIRQQHATRCPDMPPNHINKWSERSMSLALEHAGLKAHKFEIEPPAWGAVQNSLYLRVRADGQFRSRSLSGLAYRIRNRRIRGYALRAVGVLTIPKLLPHLAEARLRANFLVIAGAPQDSTPC